MRDSADGNANKIGSAGTSQADQRREGSGDATSIGIRVSTQKISGRASDNKERNPVNTVVEQVVRELEEERS